MSSEFSVAVVGATGAVGQQIIKLLEDRNFPVGNLRLLASSRSRGKKIEFKGKRFVVEELDENSFQGVQIAFFCAGGEFSEKYAPIAAEAGAVCVDKSSAFRMDPDVPLVIPEVNPGALADYKKTGIVASPNCSTIQMVLVLAPLHAQVPIRRVVVSTYQSVSGAGAPAMEELARQTVAIFNAAQHEPEVFDHQIAFNCIPHIDAFMANAYTREEMKMVHETRKVMGEPSLRITATAVRVPVFSCHSESINIEFESAMSADQARRILADAPGVAVCDDPINSEYPMNVMATEKDDTFVGRIRADETVENGLNLWCVSDNLRKGAATNAVQIAELLVQEHL
jgi:aspartate-semialdehyde dehydrogenase